MCAMHACVRACMHACNTIIIVNATRYPPRPETRRLTVSDWREREHMTKRVKMLLWLRFRECRCSKCCCGERSGLVDVENVVVANVLGVSEKQKTILIAEAKREAESIRGNGDGQAIKIYADAFGRDAKFFKFYRSMLAYEKTFVDKGTLWCFTERLAGCS